MLSGGVNYTYLSNWPQDSPNWFSCDNCADSGQGGCWVSNTGSEPDNVYLQSQAPACPSASDVLGLFALVNLLSAAFGLLAGHRRVSAFLTRNRCGGKDSSSWAYMWLLPLALHLAANATIGTLVHFTPGYGHVSISQVMLLLTARPRLSWMILVWANDLLNLSFQRKDRESAQMRDAADGAPAAVDRVSGPLRGWRIEAAFLSSARSSLIAELIISMIATYPMVSALNFARENLGGLTIDYAMNPQRAYMMWAGAVLYMFFVIIWVIGAAAECIFEHSEYLSSATGVSLLTTYLGSWLFWAGYVDISSEEYVSMLCASGYQLWAINCMLCVR